MENPSLLGVISMGSFMIEFPEKAPIADAPLSVVLQSPPGGEAGVAYWTRYLDALRRTHEVITLGDPQTEGGKELIGRFPNVKLLPGIAPEQPGALLRAAIGCATHPLLLIAGPATAYAPENLEKCLNLIDQVDVVAGYRDWPADASRRRWHEWFDRMKLRWFFGLRIKDAECNFKLCRLEIFARIPIQSDGPFVHAEILAKANFLGKIIAEAPIDYRPDGEVAQAGPSRFRDALQVFRHPDFGPPTLERSADLFAQLEQ